jgi:hypothetical protein
MFTKEEKGTTGELVSRITVLNVLAHNALEDNHLDSDTRREVMREARSLARTSPRVRVEGFVGPKVHVRMIERCMTGVWN